MRVMSDENVATTMRPSATSENFFEISLDGFFGNRVARFFGVRAVHHKGVHAHLAELLEFLEAVRFAFVVVVQAEVREVDDVADRGFHHHAGRFRDRVRHAEEVRADVIGDLHLVAVFDDDDVHLWRVRKIIRRFSMIAFVIEVA